MMKMMNSRAHENILFQQKQPPPKGTFKEGDSRYSSGTDKPSSIDTQKTTTDIYDRGGLTSYLEGTQRLALNKGSFFVIGLKNGRPSLALQGRTKKKAATRKVRRGTPGGPRLTGSQREAEGRPA